MIKYRIKWDKIEAHEVLRETDKMVVLAPKSSANPRSAREAKEAKRSDWLSWHDTWEDAHAFLVEQAQREIESLRRRLEQANGRLGSIRGMRPNAEVTGAPRHEPNKE